MVDIENAAEELCHGQGYLLFEGYFSQEQIAEARELIYSLTAEEPARASYFHGDKNETAQSGFGTCRKKAPSSGRCCPTPARLPSWSRSWETT